MNMIGSILGRAIAIVAVFAAFAALRKYVSIRPRTGDDEKSFDELDGQFNRYLAESESPGAFQLLLPQSAIWWFFPGFAALAFAYELTLQLWSIFGNGGDANSYSDWTNLKTAHTSSWGRIDYRKSLRCLSLLVAVPIGIFTVLALPMHAAVGPDSIHSCGYAFAACRVYPYTAAQRMTVIQGFRGRDGSFTARAGIVVDFDGGKRWSSAEIGNFRHNVDFSLIQIMEAKTHLPIQSAETESDILPMNPKR